MDKAVAARRSRAPSWFEVIAAALWLVLALWTLRDLTRDQHLFAGVGLLLVTLGLGLLLAALWQIRLLVAIFAAAKARRAARPSLRWLAFPAAAGIACFAPTARWADGHFHAHQAEYEALATSLRTNGIAADTFPRRIGDATIKSAWMHDGCLFICTERSPDGERGFAHSPLAPPPPIGDWVVTQRIRHLHGPWYRYSLFDD